MGEIAEMMPEGDLCGSCGVALEGPSLGVPRYCSRECALSAGAAPEPEKPKREGPAPFFVKRRDQFPELETWLNERDFNCGGYFKNDRNGNPMVNIGLDTDPDNDWKLPKKRGLIVVVNRKLLPDVEAIVKRIAAAKSAERRAP